MMNFYAEWLTEQRDFSVIPTHDPCPRFSPSQISCTPWVGFEPKQNLGSGSVD